MHNSFVVSNPEPGSLSRVVRLSVQNSGKPKSSSVWFRSPHTSKMNDAEHETGWGQVDLPVSKPWCVVKGFGWNVKIDPDSDCDGQVTLVTVLKGSRLRKTVSATCPIHSVIAQTS
ncbi:hypothetical protein KOR42_16340 [Thalassoglobus neptunius]|uniref:Uncharacterized protein n=1 Tax=Thalassoglobus neptunius TaxID=1938619 RepID=A0A5C5X8R3_9PLAN|nr:hypothetical protein KOR42_16340 [Thalassoglobus neptunius]